MTYLDGIRHAAVMLTDYRYDGPAVYRLLCPVLDRAACTDCDDGCRSPERCPCPCHRQKDTP